MTLETKQTLIKYSLDVPKDPKKFHPTKIILMGSGVVKNSYKPLLAALAHIPPVVLRKNSYQGIYKEGAIHGLANGYFSYRVARDLCLSNLSRGNFSGISNNQLALVSSFPQTRVEISKQYKATPLTLRSEFKKFLLSQDWNAHGACGPTS